MFSKMLQERSLEEVANYACELGFDGIDLTCRKGGHILSADIEHELPRAVAFFGEHGLSVPLITTGITSAREPWAAETFRTAGQCGIPYIKLGYWLFDKFGQARQTIDRMRCDLDELEALAAQNGVCAVVHLHCNHIVSSNPALLWMLLMDRDVRHIAAYLDPGNMAVEGASYGWKLGMDLLAPYTRMVALKNFRFEQSAGRQCAEWKAKLCPLQDGIVPYPEMLELLDRINYTGYVSVHSEDLSMTPEQRIAQARLDLAYLDRIESGQRAHEER
jgi:sugar phosphate isomerase/epimerase